MACQLVKPKFMTPLDSVNEKFGLESPRPYWRGSFIILGHSHWPLERELRVSMTDSTRMTVHCCRQDK